MPETAIISAVSGIFIQNCSALNCSDFSLFYDTESRFSALFIISCKKVRNLTEHRYNTCPYSINKAACKIGCQQHCRNIYHHYICLRESYHLKQKSSNSNQSAYKPQNKEVIQNTSIVHNLGILLFNVFDSLSSLQQILQVFVH